MNRVVNRLLNSITYILPIDNQKKCYLVDCGDLETIINYGWNVCGVLLTHSHYDHCYGLNKLVEYFPKVRIYTNESGKNGLMNSRLNLSKYSEEVENFEFLYTENIVLIKDELSLFLYGDLEIKVLLTPGHDPSCISYIVGNNIFTGDAYIPGINVVTTFPQSNKVLAINSQTRLQVLEKEGYNILSGHKL